MDPLGGDLAASLLDGPGVVAHHEHLVAADVEFTRLEGVGLLQLADEAEEFLNAGRPLAASDGRIVLGPPDDVPVGIGVSAARIVAMSPRPKTT